MCRNEDVLEFDGWNVNLTCIFRLALKILNI
jgi:hypothetical protein